MKLALATVAFAGVLAVAGAVAPVQAQTAMERAAELKVWREQCGDPDIDLRLAFIEMAIESDDATIERICVRQAIESDNADVRNLGLRAAVASLHQIKFDVAMPPELQKALQEAGQDEKKLRAVEGDFGTRNYAILRNGLIFEIDDASAVAGTSKWYPMVGQTTRGDKQVGTASVIGDEIAWAGEASLHYGTCKLNVALMPGAVLEGTFQCSDQWPFPVRGRLL